MDALHERSRTIRSAGAELAVFEYGPEPSADAPTLLLVHGYPDDHRVFLPVIGELAATHHIVAFDTRNAGRSRAVDGAGFTVAELVDDVFAVIDDLLDTLPDDLSDDLPDAASGAVSGSAPPRRVRLVGHDWGSIQGWAVVQDERAAGRILDYTSISGPDLRHFSRWLDGRLKEPRLLPQGIAQLLRSWYVGAFQVPALPELFWRLVMTRRYEFAARRNVGSDPVRGLALYRTNMFTALKPPRRRVVTIPVHVIVPLKDPFLSPHLVDGLDEWVEDLTTTTVPGGHWWIAAHPRAFAELVVPGLRSPEEPERS